MELTHEILQELSKPFDVEKIKFKVQTKPNQDGTSLIVAYIDARNVMDRLDQVVGGEWGDTYKPGHPSGLECALTICGTTRCDVGADNNENETEKSAYSDAFKRAAVKFGVGRFLYDLPKMFAKVRPMGKSFVLEDREELRLHNIIKATLSGKPVIESTIKIKRNAGALLQAIVNQEIAENVHEAKNMMAKCNWETSTMDKFLIWASVYRGWRDSGLESDAAAEKTNAGERPL